MGKVDLMTEFSIELSPAMRDKYKIKALKGSVLNLQGPGGYITPDLSRVEKEEDGLLDWLTHRGLVDRNSDYYLKFKNNFVRLSHFLVGMNISEELMKCFNLFHGWTFLHDDILDDDHPIGKYQGGFPQVAAAHEVFVDILKDKYGRDHIDNFPPVDFPLFKELCHAMKDFHRQMHNAVPYYSSRCTPFVEAMTEYLDSYIFYYVDPINGRYSEESGKFWLRCNTGWKAWLEIVSLLRDVTVSQAMRKDLYFCRLLVASGDVICCINDVLGASKDLGKGKQDTLVMFKHFRKGCNIEEAQKQTVDYLNEQVKDIRLLIEVLRRRYETEGDAYARTLEDFIDGYIIWCSTCQRYGGKTSISLKEVEN